MSSRFHKEFYKEASAKHDKLILSCITKEGLKKIALAIGLNDIKRKFEQDGIFCGKRAIYYCGRNKIIQTEKNWGCASVKEEEVQYCEHLDRERLLEQLRSERYYLPKEGLNETVKSFLKYVGPSLKPYKVCFHTHYKAVGYNAKYNTEVLMKNGNFIVGYADLIIRYGVKLRFEMATRPNIVIENYKPEKEEIIERHHVLVEGKPNLSSFGAVIRQIKTYKECCKSKPKLVIATYIKPEKEILEVFKNEGISVVSFEGE